jgi:hypothetical protein
MNFDRENSNNDKGKNFKDLLDKELKKVRDEYYGLEAENYENGKMVSNSRTVFQREDYRLTRISSTILIPEKYLANFKKKLAHYKGVRGYITYLLSKYRIHISNGIIPAYSNLTTKYQDKNQNLQKFSFRPLAADWAELKLYRNSFGMSISALLVYLLIADFSDFAWAVSHFLMGVGIPTMVQLDLTSKVHLWDKRNYYSIVFQFR